MDVKTPKDLAEIVFVKMYSMKNYPKEETLTRLFETMYFASMQTEEGDSVKFSVAYMDPDPDENEFTIYDFSTQWKSYKFGNDIPFTFEHVTKIAKAFDPIQSKLLVFHDDNDELKIWGIVDYELMYEKSVNENSRSTEFPGSFIAIISDVGCIDIFIGGHREIVFERYRFIENEMFTLKDIKPLIDAIDPTGKSIIQNVKQELGKEIKENGLERIEIDENFLVDKVYDKLSENMNPLLMTYIKLIIDYVQSFKLGGAIIVTNKIQSEQNLDVTFKLMYDGLRSVITKKIVTDILCNRTSRLNRLFEYPKIKDDPSKKDVFNDASMRYRMTKIESDLSFGKCINFVANLTRIDGAVLIDENMVIKGFGCKIDKVDIDTEKVRKAKDLEGLKKDSYTKKSGTRHKSMMKFCFDNPGSIGFVVSQDGDINAMTKKGENVVVWRIG